ncbi:LysE family translocator [Neisseria yangbaofengii]|uniref:LysE family translocator n=1 Tax=Neisseria yangbaofengii TaxID=2709396 RepID=UPI0013EE3E9F|nr:LysE family translocator [Neisseria yangbaofengii]
MDTGNIVYFFLSSVLVAALPGPAMMLVVQGSVNGGWPKGAAVTGGILSADALLLAAVCLGVGSLIASSPSVLAVMNIFSSLYLIYLAVGSFRQIRSLKLELETPLQKSTWQSGFIITIINPKTIIFLIAYLPRFVNRDSAWSESMQLAVLSFWFLAAVAVVMLCYALAAHRARNFLSKAAVRRAMEAVFGTVLLFIGLSGLSELLDSLRN